MAHWSVGATNHADQINNSWQALDSTQGLKDVKVPERFRWPPGTERLHASGSDLVDLVKTPCDKSGDWWWTTCNHYNERTRDSHYTQTLMSRPFKIGSHEAFMSKKSQPASMVPWAPPRGMHQLPPPPAGVPRDQSSQSIIRKRRDQLPEPAAPVSLPTGPGIGMHRLSWRQSRAQSCISDGRPAHRRAASRTEPPHWRTPGELGATADVKFVDGQWKFLPRTRAASPRLVESPATDGLRGQPLEYASVLAKRLRHSEITEHMRSAFKQPQCYGDPQLAMVSKLQAPNPVHLTHGRADHGALQNTFLALHESAKRTFSR